MAGKGVQVKVCRQGCAGEGVQARVCRRGCAGEDGWLGRAGEGAVFITLGSMNAVTQICDLIRDDTSLFTIIHSELYLPNISVATQQPSSAAY